MVGGGMMGFGWEELGGLVGVGMVGVGWEQGGDG